MNFFLTIVSALMSVLIAACASAPQYPPHWFAPVEQADAPSWEILPQAAKPGEVILSKRNELGILSNFAATPFEMDGKRYASVEGFWQSLKYPESPQDIRARAKDVEWILSRQQVEQLSSFKAKRAGRAGSRAMKALEINWVTYRGRRMTYRTLEKGAHYNLIRRAMREKLRQNPAVRDTLLATGDLKLMPDHTTKQPAPPAWKYYAIWMELRSELQNR